MADPAYEAITKAKNQRDSGNFLGAMDTLENYLLGDRYNTKVRLVLAEMAFKGNRKDYGMIQLEVILDIEPDNLDALKAMVTVLKQDKKTIKEAKKYYDHLVDVCPNEPDILNSYGVFCKYQLVDYDLAETYYKKAIDIDDRNADYHLNYAILLVNDLKRYTDGKFELERAIELDPHNQRAKDAYKRLIDKKFKNGKEKKSLFPSFKRK